MNQRAVISLFLVIGLFFITDSSVSQTTRVTFILHAETHTPGDEVVCLHIENGWQFLPMSKVSENEWRIDLDLFSGLTYRYKYCRNYMQAGAEEEWCGRDRGYREKFLANSSSAVQDTVKKWRWWPTNGVVPEINTSSHLSASPNNLPPPSFQCGVELPDFWWLQFSPVVESALDKIVKNTNANWVQYAPIPEITRFHPTPIIVREGNNGTPEADLIKIMTQSHKRGLKLFLRPFPWALGVRDTSPEFHDNAWWIAYEAQWRPIILYYANISQQYGVEMLSFNMWPNIWRLSEAEVSIIDSLAQILLSDVRAIYAGVISIEYNPFGPDLAVYERSDNLHFKIWDYWPYRLSASKEPSLGEMADSLRKGMDSTLKQGAIKWGKPIILAEISANSFDGAVNGSAHWEDQAYWNPDDPNVPLDLQEQADVYEAMLQAITERDWIIGAYSFGYNYWNSLDKTPSVRSKPAEKVLAKWWRWILPNNVHLSISSTNGGTVAPSPASYIFTKDTTVTITATADSGFEFSRWKEDVPSEHEGDNPLFLKMNSDKNLIATFTKLSTGVHTASDLPTHFCLQQNYPNPFNPTTTIKYQIPITASVSLDVYNIEGQWVTNLVNDKQKAGYYQIQWNGKNEKGEAQASGIYIIRFFAGEFVQTKKMLLLQ